MSTNHPVDFCFPRSTGALKEPLLCVQDVHALQVEGQTNQAPFARCSGQAAQRELSEAQDLLDNPDHGFYRTLAQAVDGLTDLGLQLVSHLDLRTGILSRWFRLFLEKGMPIFMMRFTAGGNVGDNAQRFALVAVGRA